MIKRLTHTAFYLTCLGILISSVAAHGQGPYYQVTTWTNTTATQTLNNTTVTITSTGGNYNIPYNFCSNSPGPYLLGHYSAGSYTFAFSPQAASVRVRMHGMQSGEIVSVDINGAPYTLTTANNLIQCSACNAFCQDPVAAIVGGTIHAQTFGTSGGQFVIENVPGGISSIKLSHNGVQAGVGISLEFQENYVEASNNGPVCWGDTLKLFGVPTITNGVYSWTGPNGFTSNEQNPVIPNPTAADAGVYTLDLNGYTDTTTVVLLPRPSDPVVQYNPPVCAGSSLILTASSTPSNGTVYTWTGPNGYSGTGSTITIPNAQSANSGVYSVQAAINTCKSKIVNTTVEILQPTESFQKDTICPGGSFTFNGTVLTKAGNYVDSFTNSIGCDSLAHLHLVIRPRPPLAINFENKAYCNHDSVTLTASGAASYTWFHDGSNIGTGNTQRVRLSTLKNVYEVKAVDKYNCTADKSVTVTAKPCCQIFVPNAFTPNKDGLNDFFTVKTSGSFLRFRLQVYNRYGQMIFSSFTPDGKWDGTVSGKPADMGTYFYQINGQCEFGPEIHKKGSITLIR